VFNLTQDFTLGDKVGDVTTVFGGNGSYHIVGSDSTEFISVGNGNNTITVGNGNDGIVVGNGDNTITLGAGTSATVVAAADDHLANPGQQEHVTPLSAPVAASTGVELKQSGTFLFTHVNSGATATASATGTTVTATGTGLTLTDAQKAAFANAFTVTDAKTGAWTFDLATKDSALATASR
jgi:hypothetical protein